MGYNEGLQIVNVGTSAVSARECAEWESQPSRTS